MAIAPTKDKKPQPYEFREFPKFVFSEKHPAGVVVNDPDEEAALEASEGPLYASAAALPKPKAAEQVDLAAENAALKRAIDELRVTNSDLSARLILASDSQPGLMERVGRMVDEKIKPNTAAPVQQARAAQPAAPAKKDA